MKCLPDVAGLSAVSEKLGRVFCGGCLPQVVVMETATKAEQQHLGRTTYAHTHTHHTPTYTLSRLYCSIICFLCCCCWLVVLVFDKQLLYIYTLDIMGLWHLCLMRVTRRWRATSSCGRAHPEYIYYCILYSIR